MDYYLFLSWAPKGLKSLCQIIFFFLHFPKPAFPKVLPDFSVPTCFDCFAGLVLLSPSAVLDLVNHFLFLKYTLPLFLAPFCPSIFPTSGSSFLVSFAALVFSPQRTHHVVLLPRIPPVTPFPSFPTPPPHPLIFPMPFRSTSLCGFQTCTTTARWVSSLACVLGTSTPEPPKLNSSLFASPNPHRTPPWFELSWLTVQPSLQVVQTLKNSRLFCPNLLLSSNW